MAEDIKNVASSETIEIVPGDKTQQVSWIPTIGEETLKLLDHLKFPNSDREMLQKEARSVLSNCISPSSIEGTETGLVIGYIQSGKTTSFTTVAALASDNDYRLIIVITGITKNLFKQSNDRLEKDLRIKTRTDRKWQFLSNPQDRPDIKQRIAKAIQKKSSLLGISKQTVLITVMKNRTHLNNLIKLLSGLTLKEIPTLIIDDEADQASLNNLVNKGKESATYRRILEIRHLLPHHTFLQYTATPQAPLLINIIDILSPKFAALLTPGPAYTGGRIFFEHDFRLIKRIRENEIPSKDQLLTEPPDSLLQAMQIFFLGVASGLKNGAKGNRSMMVHPSKETMQHANYDLWVRQIQQNWTQILQLNNCDQDHQDLVNIFKSIYDDLHQTVDDLPPFDELRLYLPIAVNEAIVTMVNAAAGTTPQPEWDQDYAHILVGGEVLNRGYTIEGLTVTYMPRSKGVGNADTIQQRARWFGYKAEYLGYCRVYLTDEQRDIYRSYVNHEENIRSQLRNQALAGKSLNEWKRAFLLSPELRPTRHDVMDLEYLRSNYSHEWFEQYCPHESVEAIEANQETINQFLSKLSFSPDKGHPKRTEMQKHLVSTDVELDFVYQELLTKFLVVDPADSYAFLGLLLQLENYLEQKTNNEYQCTIYQMSGGKTRTRSINKEGRIPTLFQGPNPDKTGEYYPGDSKIFWPNHVTIQIHIIDIIEDKKLIANNVPTIAIRLPMDMSTDWIIQTNKKASKKFARQNWE